MKKEIYILLFLCFLTGFYGFSDENFKIEKENSVKEMNSWPQPIPCRIKEGKNLDLFIMTLGDVKTPLADGIFDPVKDRVILNDGRIIENYYKDILKIKYFKPIDKSVFNLPPSGWCSWYYYYQEINEDEVKKNAKWLSENLKDFGAEYCQIDDGWQGKGHGMGDNRDWTTIDKRFPEGMEKLANFIKEVGLKPGLWLAPHGQSNWEVVKKSKAFLLDKDQKSISDTWEGNFLLDPSKKEAIKYLEDLFTVFSSKWGYEYFKIDGQPIVINEFKKYQKKMKSPEGDPEELYRDTLFAIRRAIGSNRYLLGCWGIPLQGIGIMNGSRTGGDVLLNWEGFFTALNATMRHYYLHNIAWYCDPDVMLVRYPLTLESARAWATLQGLTGQALMASDRLYDLSPERVEILKRVYPAVDIRPLDLFPSNKNKRIWDLKVNYIGREYDVIGIFNYDEEKSIGIKLDWHELGFSADSLIHVYDFWQKEYLGCWEKGMYVPILPASCRVLTLIKAEEKPQLISTSRHITQGWVDLKEINYDENKMKYSGKSALIKDDPYELRFVFPRSGKTFRIKEAKAESLSVKISNYHGWGSVQFTSPINTEISWEVYFEPADLYTYPVETPDGVRFEVKGLDGIKLSWNPLYSLSAGYLVYLNDEVSGYTPVNSYEIKGLDVDKVNKVKIYGVWFDGSKSKKPAEIEFKLSELIQDEIYLSDVEPVSISSGWGMPQMDKAVSRLPLKIGDNIYKKGIGTHAISDIIYNINNLYNFFSAWVGIDSNTQEKRGSVEFIVYGDDNELWRSSIMKKEDPVQKVLINITGVKILRLYVSDGGDGISWDHANWAEAKLSRKND
ncbi:MAG: NPCBM/NEW2 domain-containing protein [Acidobacteriota bacterium]